MVAAYEVVGKIAGRYWSWNSRRTASHVFGGFGVAALAAKLSGLNAPQTAGACGAPFPRDALEGPYGFCASQLGGLPGDIAVRLGTLGTEFEIMTAVLKPIPARRSISCPSTCFGA